MFLCILKKFANTPARSSLGFIIPHVNKLHGRRAAVTPAARFSRGRRGRARNSRLHQWSWKYLRSIVFKELFRVKSLVFVVIVFQRFLLIFQSIQPLDELDFMPGHLQCRPGKLGAPVPRPPDALARLLQRGNCKDAVDDRDFTTAYLHGVQRIGRAVRRTVPRGGMVVSPASTTPSAMRQSNSPVADSMCAA